MRAVPLALSTFIIKPQPAIVCSHLTLFLQTAYRGVKNPEAVERKRKKQEEVEKQAMTTSVSGGGGGGLKVSFVFLLGLNNKTSYLAEIISICTCFCSPDFLCEVKYYMRTTLKLQL